MSITIIIGLILGMTFTTTLILLAAYIFYNYIYTPHILKTTDINFEELMLVLRTTINTEIDIYEKNIFTKKAALTNSNFDNYYYDIVNSIIDSLSDDFFTRMGIYMKKEAIVTIICRYVKDYLVEKSSQVSV